MNLSYTEIVIIVLQYREYINWLCLHIHVSNLVQCQLWVIVLIQNHRYIVVVVRWTTPNIALCWYAIL